MSRTPRMLTLVVAAAFAAWAAPIQAQELRVGASISLTGTYAKPGKYTQEGYLLCEKDGSSVESVGKFVSSALCAEQVFPVLSSPRCRIDPAAVLAAVKDKPLVALTRHP